MIHNATFRPDSIYEEYCRVRLYTENKVYLTFSRFQFIFLLATPLLVVNFRAVKNKVDANELDPYLKQLAMSTLIFVLLFGIGQLL